MPRIDPRLLAFARQMRREPTPAEARLWGLLRAKRFKDVKFSHQTVIEGAIADFAARSRKLIVELDGPDHDFKAAADAARTKRLERAGYRVIRFTNDDVMTNAEGVLMAIEAALATQPSSRLRGEGRPRSGQGEGQSITAAPHSPSPGLASLRHPLPGGETGK